ncbi:LacI family DNA-binding transcriptional regulator [Candidatus Poriferisodalis sp.]|uniref:LacI family DNA-binding transcriptional regulator n=1 Tax=Candidatus Poriferisodalis sp. TaxID=3101277 RepID=UPI003B01F3EF
MTTIYDVAREAGVSISTVSLALNSPERVRPETLKRIMLAVDSLGFVPKSEAMARARRGTGRVGVIAPVTAFPTAFGLRLSGIFAGTKNENMDIVLFDHESAATSRLVSLPVTRRVDGLIIMSVPFDEAIEHRLLRQNIPTVLLEIPHRGFSTVIVDHEGGGRDAGRLLVERGHSRFGYLGARQTHDYPSQSRLQLAGFASAIGTAPDTRSVDYGFANAVEAGTELLSQPDRPTAILAHDDLLASGLLLAARQLGLAVPGDVAIVGFNDAHIAEPLGLTTVRQPFEESGRTAIRMLLERIANPDISPRDVTLRVSLIERDTT